MIRRRRYNRRIVTTAILLLGTMPEHWCWLQDAVMISVQRTRCPDGIIDATLLCCSIGSSLDDGDNRDIASLKDWALENGIQLNGVELVREMDNGEWGVKLATNPLVGSGNGKEPVMTIPNQVILSSEMLPKPELRSLAYHSLVAHKMEQYLPEFSLFLVLLQEVEKEDHSFWYAWLSSLPRSFDIGVCFDELETAYARKLGMGNYLDHQHGQWQAFEASLRDIFPGHAQDAHKVKWAFSVVLTRSWRAGFRNAKQENRPIANLVPMGDMFNHRASATVSVKQDADDCPVTVHLKQQSLVDDTTSVEEEMESVDNGLYLNYGFSENPERFLIVFGFADTSSPRICATSIRDLFVGGDHDENGLISWRSMGFQDSSKLVLYCQDGGISNTLWNAVLFQVIQSNLRNHPDNLQYQCDWKIFHTTCTNLEILDTLSNDDFLGLHQKYRQEVVDFLRRHVEDLLTNQFGPLPDFSGEDLLAHPRLAMLLDYHLFMRSVYQKVHHGLLSDS
ncbi:M protein repeat protein [Seminavis robusta]|uniref:M protein repeat protein n=1 Tax=Seminavis robusta TaxID=568900 RepID=A0A9N8HTB2_9STRA|nr:M protein repeat protein [Seminavis robusta]|eukprot:Sro1491_g277140.1 M protein repeat protein (506) ;mRNA; r:18806-20323